MLYLVGVIITFFLTFILVSKRHKTTADIILFSWLIIIGIHLFFYYLYFSGKYLEYTFLLGVNIPFPLLHGPFLYLYTAAVTNQLKNWKKNILHFLPVIISYLSIIDFFMLSNEEKIFVYENQGQGFETISLIISSAVFCSGIVYVIWSLLLLKNHKEAILNQFSYSEKINLNWLRYLIYGLGIIWVFVIFSNDELLFSAVVFYVIFIGYFGINQVGIFTSKASLSDTDIVLSKEIELSIEDDIITDSKSLKYSKSGLNLEAAIEIHDLLTSRMEKDQLYTNSELTLVELAQLLNIHPNNLSQVINTFEEKNFYDYINSKRVELFLKLAIIPENKKYTILSLAYDCGFNSKSSFNKYFKKVTNMTPSAYLNTIGTRI